MIHSSFLPRIRWGPLKHGTYEGSRTVVARSGRLPWRLIFGTTEPESTNSFTVMVTSGRVRLPLSYRVCIQRVKPASTDETIQIHPYPPLAGGKTNKPPPPITEKKSVKSILPLLLHPHLDIDAFPYLLCATGDVFRVYDISSLDEPGFIREVDGHWHDVTSLRLWLRTRSDGKGKEVWVVSGGLDRTLRRWKLSGGLKDCLEDRIVTHSRLRPSCATAIQCARQ